MPFRRRKRAEPELDKLLDGYHASTPPSSQHSGVGTIRCWRCQGANIYDARRDPPVRCRWCRALF